MPLKLLFLGTGEFAQPSFERLLASSHDVVGLVTQPDRTGPGRHTHIPPLKQAAIAAEVPVFQPENVNLPESLAKLREFGADLFVVAAYGQILKPALLEIPRLGAINIHASLLPRHRGAAPINYAILAGDVESGVSIFQIEPKLDAGPVLGMTRTPIGPKETAGDLELRLSQLAPDLIVEVVNRIESGTAAPLLQDATQVTRAPKMPKAFGLIDWSRLGVEIERHTRAMQPWPMAWSFLHLEGQQPLRIVLLDVEPQGTRRGTPGEILRAEGGELIVQAGDAPVRIIRLQPAGKRPMEAAEFLRGRRIPAGSRFGPESNGEQPASLE